MGRSSASRQEVFHDNGKGRPWARGPIGQLPYEGGSSVEQALEPRKRSVTVRGKNRLEPTLRGGMGWRG